MSLSARQLAKLAARKAAKKAAEAGGAAPRRPRWERTDAAFVRAVARMDTSVDAATALVTLERLIMEARELVELSMRRAGVDYRGLRRSTLQCRLSKIACRRIHAAPSKCSALAATPSPFVSPEAGRFDTRSTASVSARLSLSLTVGAGCTRASSPHLSAAHTFRDMNQQFWERMSRHKIPCRILAP
jgi:hypothetical protein